MNMADAPQLDVADRRVLEASLTALDATANALAAALLTLAKTRKEIDHILHPRDGQSRQDEMRWSCD